MKHFKFGQGLPSLEGMQGQGNYTPPKSWQTGQMAVQKFQLPKQNLAIRANDISNKNFQTKVAQQIDQSAQAQTAPPAPGTGMMQGTPQEYSPGGMQGTPQEYSPGGMPSRGSMSALPAVGMMGQAGTPNPAEMQMGAAAAETAGSQFESEQQSSGYGANFAGANRVNEGPTAQIAREPTPAMSADAASRLGIGDGEAEYKAPYADELAGMLDNSDKIYEQDQSNVDRLIAKLQRRGASANAMSGATGSGGFAESGSNAANQAGINAAQQAAAAHAGRNIDLQQSVLEKQIAQAEAQNDRASALKLRKIWEQVERDRMDLENPKIPTDDENTASMSSSKFKESAASMPQEEISAWVTSQTDGMSAEALEAFLRAHNLMTRTQANGTVEYIYTGTDRV
jgi:hypothetical protein